MTNSHPDPKTVKLPSYTEAQHALANSLLTLWATKPLHQITVRELVQTAHVARSTFYVYYQNVDQLAEQIENNYIAQIIQRNQSFMDTSISARDFGVLYGETVAYIQENSQVFHTFLVANVNNRFIQKWKQGIQYHLLERNPALKEKKNSGLILEMIATAVITAFSFLLSHPHEVDVQYTAQIVTKALETIDLL